MQPDTISGDVTVRAVTLMENIDCHNILLILNIYIHVYLNNSDTVLQYIKNLSI